MVESLSEGYEFVKEIPQEKGEPSCGDGFFYLFNLFIVE